MLHLWGSGFGGSVPFGALLTFGIVACGGSDDGEDGRYRFGAAEVEQLVIGSWTGTWTGVSGGQASRLALDVSRLPAQRAACGSRELGEGSGQVGPAASTQCVSTSAMLLQASLSLDGVFSGVPLSGNVEVAGFELSRASLSLSGNEHSLIAGWSDGRWHDCRVQGPNFGELLANCTLERAP